MLREGRRLHEAVGWEEGAGMVPNLLTAKATPNDGANPPRLMTIQCFLGVSTENVLSRFTAFSNRHINGIMQLLALSAISTAREHCQGSETQYS